MARCLCLGFRGYSIVKDQPAVPAAGLLRSAEARGDEDGWSPGAAQAKALRERPADGAAARENPASPPAPAVPTYARLAVELPTELYHITSPRPVKKKVRGPDPALPAISGAKRCAQRTANVTMLLGMPFCSKTRGTEGPGSTPTGISTLTW